MATYRYAANEIKYALKQNFDDADITMSLVVYWMHVIGDRFRKLHIEKYSSGAFLNVFRDVPVEQDEAVPYKFIELPARIYDYHKDEGVNYISYHHSVGLLGLHPLSGVKFTRVDPNELELLYYRKEERPSPSNPYFYRVGDRLYLVGIESINIRYVELGVFTTFDPTRVINLDDVFDFPEHLLPLLTREILNLGRFVLMSPGNQVNDGTSKDFESGSSTPRVPEPVQDIQIINPQMEEGNGVQQ